MILGNKHINTSVRIQPKTENAKGGGKHYFG